MVETNHRYHVFNEIAPYYRIQQNIMKKTSLIILFMCAENMCYAAQNKTPEPAPVIEPVQIEKSTLSPEQSQKQAGPVGIGPLKIGMEKDAVFGLKVADGAYLAEPLTYVNSRSPIDGVKKYSTKFIFNNLSEPIPMVLTFTFDKLSGLYINFSRLKSEPASIYEKIKTQIIEKYGKGKTIDNRRDERCHYRNGKSFDINMGDLVTTWTQKLPSGDEVETNLATSIHQSCPHNLLYGEINTSRWNTLEIRHLKKNNTAAGGSLF